MVEGSNVPRTCIHAKDIEEPIEMKTPIQELIDWLNKNGDLRLYGGREKTIHEITLKMRSMLEKEKKVMAKVYYDCFINSDGVKLKFDFEEYYNETFNTKEK